MYMLNFMQKSVIEQAIKLGFNNSLDFDNSDLKDFFYSKIDDLEQEEDFAQVESTTDGQYVRYGWFESWGEVVDWSMYEKCKENEKIYHSYFVDINQNNVVIKMRLYDFKNK